MSNLPKDIAKFKVSEVKALWAKLDRQESGVHCSRTDIVGRMYELEGGHDIRGVPQAVADKLGATRRSVERYRSAFLALRISGSLELTREEMSSVSWARLRVIFEAKTWALDNKVAAKKALFGPMALQQLIEFVKRKAGSPTAGSRRIRLSQDAYESLMTTLGIAEDDRGTGISEALVAFLEALKNPRRNKPQKYLAN